jgi:uncharacterized protein (DUF952 family)
VRNPVAYHLIPRAMWEAADASRPLRGASLADEGFVHLTHRMTNLVDVANAFYREVPGPHLVLTLALPKLTSPWRYDGDERYPHVYGPIDRVAITEVRPIERTPDGGFLPIERPDPRTPPDVAALVRALRDGKVAFVVVGSAGAALLGAELDPGDLDVCIATDQANVDRLGRVLMSLGARPRVWVPGWIDAAEAAAWRPGPTAESVELLFETRHGDLDVLISSLGADGRSEDSYDELVASAVHVEVHGRAVAVASPDRLLASKLASRGPKDLRAREALERLVERAGR